jgi:hypothetical protein
MAWLRKLFGTDDAGVQLARQTQERRGTATQTQNLEPVVGGPIVSVPVPLGWRRIDHSDRRQFVPPEVVNVGGMNSAEINLIVAGPAQAGALDNLSNDLGRNYSSFSLINETRSEVSGADVSKRVRFRYTSAGNAFIDLQTHALRGKWHVILICTVVEHYEDVYDRVFQAVHEGVKVDS